MQEAFKTCDEIIGFLSILKKAKKIPET